MASIHAKSPREVYELFKAWGFTEERNSGGHLIMGAPGSGHTIPITAPGRPSKGASHTSGSAKSMKQAAKLLGLTIDEFLAGPDLLRPVVQATGTQMSYDLRTAELEKQGIEAVSNLLDVGRKRQPDNPTDLEEPIMEEKAELEDQETAEKHARAVNTRRARQEARMAAAPKPGKAKTIDGVLDRTPGPIFMSRQQVLDALIKAGGVVEDPTGSATNVLLRLMRADGYEGEQAAVSGLVLTMTEAKQVRRIHRGKRTYKIGLLDPIDGTDIEAVNLVFNENITLGEARRRLGRDAPAPAPAPTPAPAPAPARAIPAVSSLSPDDDLWDLLEIVLDGPVMMTRDTLSAVTRWMDATRDLLKIKEEAG